MSITRTSGAFVRETTCSGKRAVNDVIGTAELFCFWEGIAIVEGPAIAPCGTGGSRGTACRYNARAVAAEGNMGVCNGITGVNADVRSEDGPISENLSFRACLKPGVASPSEALVEVAGFELKKSMNQTQLKIG
jgi:hypothetical protein